MVNRPPLDPFTRKSDLNYTKSGYYLYYNAIITSLKGDNKEILFLVLKPDTAGHEWLVSNKNKLKSSSEILKFPAYSYKPENDIRCIRTAQVINT